MLDTHQFARGLASLSGLGRSSLKFGFAVTKVATYSGETLSSSDFRLGFFGDLLPIDFIGSSRFQVRWRIRSRRVFRIGLFERVVLLLRFAEIGAAIVQ